MRQLPKETIPGGAKFNATSDVYLESGHVCIRKNIVEKIFGTETVVLSVFYENDHSYLVSPASEEPFRKLHKSNQQLLKTKNAEGDKSISIQELLLDYDIDEQDKDLAFQVEERVHLLKIML